MDLSKKPLYALRDLAERLGVIAPTEYTKYGLIRKIEQRKNDIEKGEAFPICNYLGKKRADPCFLEIKCDNDGKISFYDADQPCLCEDANNHAVPLSESTPSLPIIQDETTRQKLIEIKDLAQKLYETASKLLENRYK